MTRLEYPIYKQELEPIYNNFWDSDRLKELEFRRELALHPSFANCFNPRNNLTNDFKEVIKVRTKGEHPNSVVIQIHGKQGDGKSVLGFKIAKLIDKKFSYKKLAFKTEDILNKCATAKSGDCLLLDEQTILFGEGSLRQQADLQNIEEVTRIKEVHFIFCSPTLREHLSCHYTLKVIQRNSHHRITKFGFTTKDSNYYYGYISLKPFPKYYIFVRFSLKFVVQTLILA